MDAANKKKRAEELEPYLKDHPEVGKKYTFNQNSVDYSSDKLLREYYRGSLQDYLKHLMYMYDWTKNAEEILETIKALGVSSTLTVLDFGCGPADYGIYFAEQGHNVVLCDFPEMLKFSMYRLDRRNLKYKTIEVDDNMESSLPKGLDLIIAAEVMEHLRHPFEKLKEMSDCLNPRGFIWYTQFPSENSNMVNDHLKEAQYSKQDCLDFLKKYFESIPIEEGYLWRKKEVEEE